MRILHRNLSYLQRSVEIWQFHYVIVCMHSNMVQMQINTVTRHTNYKNYIVHYIVQEPEALKTIKTEKATQTIQTP